MKEQGLLQDSEIIKMGVETLVKDIWVPVPEKSMVMNKPVWLAKMADPKAIFRWGKKCSSNEEQACL